MEREAIAAGGSNSYILTDIGEVGREVGIWVMFGTQNDNKMVKIVVKSG